MSEKHNLTRRDFLKKSAVSALGVMAGSILGGTAVAFAEERGTYIPGTYSAEAKGAQGIVTVTMTFDAENITDVKVDVSQETPPSAAPTARILKRRSWTPRAPTSTPSPPPP